MNQQTLLWFLGTGLTVALFVIARFWSVTDGLRKENQALRDANVDLKLAIVELKGISHAVDRTLSSVLETIDPPRKGGTP